MEPGGEERKGWNWAGPYSRRVCRWQRLWQCGWATGVGGGRRQKLQILLEKLLRWCDVWCDVMWCDLDIIHIPTFSKPRSWGSIETIFWSLAFLLLDILVWPKQPATYRLVEAEDRVDSKIVLWQEGLERLPDMQLSPLAELAGASMGAHRAQWVEKTQLEKSSRWKEFLHQA